MNKANGGDGIPGELLQILKDDAVKVLHSTQPVAGWWPASPGTGWVDPPGRGADPLSFPELRSAPHGGHQGWACGPPPLPCWLACGTSVHVLRLVDASSMPGLTLGLLYAHGGPGTPPCPWVHPAVDFLVQAL